MHKADIVLDKGVEPNQKRKFWSHANKRSIFHRLR